MAHGVLVTYETIRQWCRKFGQTFAHRLRRYRLTAAQYRHGMDTRFITWNEVIGLLTAACAKPPHSHILVPMIVRHTLAPST